MNIYFKETNSGVEVFNDTHVSIDHIPNHAFGVVAEGGQELLFIYHYEEWTTHGHITLAILKNPFKVMNYVNWAEKNMMYQWRNHIRELGTALRAYGLIS